MPGILLQKPCKKTSAKNSEYLNKRMDEWQQGDFDTIMKETWEIQEKMKLYLTQTGLSVFEETWGQSDPHFFIVV